MGAAAGVGRTVEARWREFHRVNSRGNYTQGSRKGSGDGGDVPPWKETAEGRGGGGDHTDLSIGCPD